MDSGLTDEDFRQIKRFAQTPRHERTPDLLRRVAAAKRDDDRDEERDT